MVILWCYLPVYCHATMQSQTVALLIYILQFPPLTFQTQTLVGIRMVHLLVRYVLWVLSYSLAESPNYVMN